MLSRTEFVDQVADAYGHLYDLIYLRTHPLVDLLVPDPALPRKQKTWQVHHLLLNVIDELKPDSQVSVLSRQWRRHQLMVLRYARALEPEKVAEQLTISRRHFYREHKIAIEAIAEILWDRYAVQPSPPQEASGTVRDVDASIKEQASLDRMELLRLEAGRVAQAGRYARVSDVVKGVLPFLQEIQHQHRLGIRPVLPEPLPSVSVERSLLRQILLGILGYLSERTQEATIALTAQVHSSVVSLTAQVEPPTAVCPTVQTEAEERLSTLQEMAALSNAQVWPVYDGQTIIGFKVSLPVAERIVLAVDDNKDVLELFRRYLIPHHYRVVTAQTAQEALEQASQLQPHAITLDLMMPRQDGWDLLQALLNQPDTQQIPIIVCSVLKQKELVLSLGATAFLEKPVTEQALLSALQALEET